MTSAYSFSMLPAPMYPCLLAPDFELCSAICKKMLASENQAYSVYLTLGLITEELSAQPSATGFMPEGFPDDVQQ